MPAADAKRIDFIAPDGVQHYKCGADYYRTAFQGANIVYVTAQP